MVGEAGIFSISGVDPIDQICGTANQAAWHNNEAARGLRLVS